MGAGRGAGTCISWSCEGVRPTCECSKLVSGAEDSMGDPLTAGRESGSRRTAARDRSLRGEGDGVAVAGKGSRMHC